MTMTTAGMSCGYCTHHQVEHPTILRSAHTVYFCSVWIPQQTVIISLYSVNGLVFITEMDCVYCSVRNGSLNITQVNLSFQMHYKCQRTKYTFKCNTKQSKLKHNTKQTQQKFSQAVTCFEIIKYVFVDVDAVCEII
jgi:hypothetical protein